MRTIVLFLILLGCGTSHITAQNDYLVTTIPNQEDPLSEEEQFIKENFPLQLLCKWTPGMKFMFIPSGRDMFLPTLSVYETEKGADNSVLKHKILTFAGYEEKSQLVNLKDVDTAKDLLTGRKIYVQSDMAQVDDANSYSGYREVSIPVNTEATITAIGVGSQAYPVKIIFQDSQGHTYYLEVALSRTNSGMDVSDFQAEKKMRYFSNAISFSSKKSGNLETLKDKYIDLTVYPKRTLAVKRVFNLENKQMENRIHLLRYTVLKIKEVKISGPGSLIILSLEDRHGSLYETEVDLKYDVIVKNENYIEDLFGFGDIHQKYPAITDKRWAIIARGDLEEGMNTDECRLSIGDPVEIQLKKDSRFETWFYNGKTLEFESGILQRFK